MFVLAQEVTAFDGLGREIHQCHGVELALARGFMTRRRHVQHGQQLAVRIKHRAGRTGQAGVAATKMLVLINAQGLALYQAGADAVGAFAGFTPVGPQPQTCVLEDFALSGRSDAVEDDPAGIGQQHRMASAR